MLSFTFIAVFKMLTVSIHFKILDLFIIKFVRKQYIVIVKQLLNYQIITIILSSNDRETQVFLNTQFIYNLYKIHLVNYVTDLGDI